MKKYIFSCICILCLSLSGCDYLDTEPGDAISSDRFWETSNAAALEQYCNLYYPFDQVSENPEICREKLFEQLCDQ